MNERKPILKNPLTWICLVAVGYWLYTYHLEHALGFLPYAIILLCPLMHFMHGHGGHGGHSQHDSKTNKMEGR